MGECGTDSFLARPRRKKILVDFAVRRMEMGIFSFDRRKWPRCLLWHGWLPGLSGVSDSEPWASSFGDLACSYLERCLGAYPVDFAC